MGLFYERYIGSEEAKCATGLLRNHAGEITITCSIPGQSSSATTTGSLFTNAFLAKAYEMLNVGFEADNSWETLMQSVKGALPSSHEPVWKIIPEFYRDYAGFKLDYERRIVRLCIVKKNAIVILAY